MESWPKHQQLNPDDSEFWPRNPKELWPLTFKVHLLEIYAYHFFLLVHIQSLILCLLWTELSVPEKEWCKTEAWCTEWHICANLYWTSLVPKMIKCNNIFRFWKDYCLCALDTHNISRCITKKFHPSSSSVIISTTNPSCRVATFSSFVKKGTLPQNVHTLCCQCCSHVTVMSLVCQQNSGFEIWGQQVTASTENHSFIPGWLGPTQSHW